MLRGVAFGPGTSEAHTIILESWVYSMKKRILSFFMSIIMMFTIVAGSVQRAKAVAPVGLGAAVVFSFLWSAGIELWRDGAGQDQSPQEALDSAIRELWSDFHSSHGSAPSLDRLEGEITFDQFGRAIIKNNIALTLNDFVKWFRDTYEVTPGSTIALTEDSSPGDSYLFTLPQSEVESLSGYNTVWALPIGAIPATPIEIWFGDRNQGRLLTVSEATTSVFMFQIDSKPGTIYMCSTQAFKRAFANLNSDREPGNYQYSNASYETVRSVSRPNNGSNFGFYDSSFSVTVNDYTSITPNVPVNGFNYTGSSSETRLQIEYIILAGDLVGSSSDLFANIGITVLDNVYDTLQDQAIAIDIGLTGAEEDNEEAFVGAAGTAFVAGEDAALGYSAVATPVPIEGVQELYPTIDDIVTDVEGLEVPSLGQALSTRFPFCIPFDVNYLFKSLSASPKRPVFEIDVIPQSLKTRIGITQNTGFTLDFGDQKYSLLLKIIRWGCLFGFILWLALITKRLIWTTGG